MLQRMVLAVALLTLALPVAAAPVVSPYSIVSDFMSSVLATVEAAGAELVAVFAPSTTAEYGGYIDPHGRVIGETTNQQVDGDTDGKSDPGPPSTNEYGGYIDPQG